MDHLVVKTLEEFAKKYILDWKWFWDEVKQKETFDPEKTSLVPNRFKENMVME